MLRTKAHFSFVNSKYVIYFFYIWRHKIILYYLRIFFKMNSSTEKSNPPNQENSVHLQSDEYIDGFNPANVPPDDSVDHE